jgi:hypothetical protein
VPNAPRFNLGFLLVIAFLQPSRYTPTDDVQWMFAGYVLAKLLELLDKALLALRHPVSRHTLTHLAAAVGGLLVCRMLMLRSERSSPAALPAVADLALVTQRS